MREARERCKLVVDPSRVLSHRFLSCLNNTTEQVTIWDVQIPFPISSTLTSATFAVAYVIFYLLLQASTSLPYLYTCLRLSKSVIMFPPTFCIIIFKQKFLCLCTQLYHYITKSKLRNRLTDPHLDDILHLASSNLSPDIERLLSEKQHQVSH